MSKFSHRSLKKELLDEENIAFNEVAQNLRELDFINQHLGGHSITLSGVKKLLGKKTKVSVCEMGCGGGDNLRVINQYCSRNKLAHDLIGIDINGECIEYAKSKSEQSGIQYIHADYKEVLFETKPDIIFSSLFCHHFSNFELVEMLRWMKENSKLGFIINDLHRHPLAYYSIWLLVKSFSRSRLVKNDAPLSVLRGFKKEDWRELLRDAGINDFSLDWKWAFRYLLIFKQAS